jgi:ABC-type multidrug transport system ATPase subunit
MAKRVAFAQAMLGEPEVVLLDEPTAGLDPRVAYEMRMSIKRLRGQCTVVISSHNLQELEQICDAAIVLDHGTVVAQGRMSELTAASSEVRITLKMSRRDQHGNAYRITAQELQLPLQPLATISGVTAVNFESDRNEVVINFDKKLVEAEIVIGHSLGILLQHQMLISAVSKGRGLEARVMDLTD